MCLLILTVVVVVFIITGLNIFRKNKSWELIPLDSADWSSIIDEDKITFVYVGRTSCEQCLDFKPMLERIVKEYKLTFYYFDTDVNKDEKEEVIKRYNIIAVPSIVVLMKDDFYIIMDSDNDKIIAEILETI